MLLCALAGVAFCTAAQAVTSDSSGSPYQAIVERNVFGLKAPPPPPDPEANKPPPPKILLTGITTILGNKRALMKMTPPATPGAPAKEQSFTLGEGQREGDLEVLEIDENAGTVKVNNFGTVTTLNWEDNGVKTAAAPAPAPAGAPKPAGFLPAPAANPFAPAGGAQPFPTARPLRLPTPTGAAASPASGGPGSVTPVYASGAPASAGGIPLVRHRLARGLPVSANHRSAFKRRGAGPCARGAKTALPADGQPDCQPVPAHRDQPRADNSGFRGRPPQPRPQNPGLHPGRHPFPRCRSEGVSVDGGWLIVDSGGCS